MSRGPDPAAAGDARHHRLMAVFIVGFLAFLALMAWAERAACRATGSGRSSCSCR
jgi:hypothetical protein